MVRMFIEPSVKFGDLSCCVYTYYHFLTILRVYGAFECVLFKDLDFNNHICSPLFFYLFYLLWHGIAEVSVCTHLINNSYDSIASNCEKWENTLLMSIITYEMTSSNWWFKLHTIQENCIFLYRQNWYYFHDQHHKTQACADWNVEETRADECQKPCNQTSLFQKTL